MDLKRCSRLFASVMIVTVGMTLVQRVAANPIVEKKEFTFNIGGSSPGEIKERIRTHRTMSDIWGRNPWVKSHWSTEWRVWRRETNNRCHTTDVESKVVFETYSPSWLGETFGTPEMKARWRRTKAALDLYLRQSMSSGMSAALEIENLQRRLGFFKTCEELDDAFHKRANYISDLYRKSEKEIARRTDFGTRQFPDLTDPIGAQTPVAGSPDKEIDGWCQMSSDLEIVRHEACHFKRSCSSDTEFCEIEYTWPSERIEIQYKNGEPTSWNDSPAGYAFINGSPCVLRHSDNQILCFFDRQPEGKWFYHLP